METNVHNWTKTYLEGIIYRTWQRMDVSYVQVLRKFVAYKFAFRPVPHFSHSPSNSLSKLDHLLETSKDRQVSRSQLEKGMSSSFFCNTLLISDCPEINKYMEFQSKERPIELRVE